MKTNTTHTLGITAFLMACTILLLSCGGCRSGKVQHSGTLENITDSTQKQIPANIQDSTSSTQQEASGHDAVFEPISLSNVYDYSVEIPTDEYNVHEHILSFYDKETKKLIKKVDLVRENPFHKMGLKRRKEPYPTSTYFLELPGVQNKYKLRNFLPKGIFHEIPEDFDLDRAIATIYECMTENKYATIAYELDWLPDAYSDEGEWDGPGYSVHHVVVYDSQGNKIYTRQFDGTSIRPSVSEDGKYLFTMACLSPEWDENIRYRFTVVNIQTNKVVYEELIENCEKHGGAGLYDDRNFKMNSYIIKVKGNLIKKFIYINGFLFNQKEFMHIDNIFPISNDKVEVWHFNTPNETVNINSLFTQIKLN